MSQTAGVSRHIYSVCQVTYNTLADIHVWMDSSRGMGLTITSCIRHSIILGKERFHAKQENRGNRRPISPKCSFVETEQLAKLSWVSGLFSIAKGRHEQRRGSISGSDHDDRPTGGTRVCCPSVLVGNRVGVGLTQSTIRSLLPSLLPVKESNEKVSRTGQHPCVHPGWKILPPRIG